ncbi:MAG: acyl-CoA thioesterase [Leptospiraceae bacterium]|nr:acyl-CoA thioesterase [Leptospiraceae bacterium]
MQLDAQKGDLTVIQEGYELATRHLVMEKDLNYFGNLFGGAMLAWLDEASAAYLMDKIGYANFVTLKLEDVFFKAPAKRGDALAIYCKILNTGRSSISIRTRAWVHIPVSGAKREIIDCKITFVCLQEGKPYAYFRSPEYSSWLARTGQSPVISGD